MRKHGSVFLLSVLMFLLLPLAAWATEVPEVTEAEYRFFLEQYAVYYLDIDEISACTDEELQKRLTATVTKEDRDYAEMLEYDLWYNDSLEESDFGKFSDAELEKFISRALADEVYADTVSDLKEAYQVEIDPVEYTPQEILALYYQTKLQVDYGITEDISEQPWYMLKDLCKVKDLEKYLKTEFDATEDLSSYSYEELYSLYDRLYLERELHETYGVTEDLSNYKLDELYKLEERLLTEQTLKEDYGITEDLSGYTDEELDALYDEVIDKYWDEYWEQQQLEAEKAYQQRIDIQINGEKLGYTKGDEDSTYWLSPNYTYTSDAEPVMKEDRVYIPFRAVFEALGAEVSYDAASKTVTAKREDRTVSFTVGQKQYTSNGVVVKMDAQAFVQEGRTFVPVRFASQALGVAVGWDSDDRTVVILDREKMTNRYKGQFTVFEKYLKHWDMGDGNLSLQGHLDCQVRIVGDIVDDDVDGSRHVEVPMSLTVEQKELFADEGINIDSAVNLDLDEMMAWLKEIQSLDSETEQLLRKLKTIQLQYILDIQQGRLYMKSNLLDLLEGQRNAWYYLSIEDYMEQDEFAEYQEMIDELQKQPKNSADYTVDEAIAKMISEISVTDAEDAETTLLGLKIMYRFMGDNNLGKTSEGYMHSIENELWGCQAKLLFQGNQNQIDGMRVVLEYDDQKSRLQLGDGSPNFMKFVLEEQDHAFTLTIKGQMGDEDNHVTVDCNGQYVLEKTEEQPLRKPNDSNPIYSLMELVESWENKAA